MSEDERRKTKDEGNGTHEVIPFVVGASNGSLMMTPAPIGMILTLREWLMRYMWEDVGSGPEVRFTEQGNVGSVWSNGVSHIIWNSGRM